MIVEQRDYHVFTGKLPELVRLYETEGIALQHEHLAGLLGVFTTDVGDDDIGTLVCKAVRNRTADSPRAAGDDRHLAAEGHRIGENDVGIRIRFCCVWISGWIFARNDFHRSSAWSRARRSSRSA